MTSTRTGRHHYVFLDPCGCCVGVTEAGLDVTTEGDAWDDMYESRAEERAAHARGVRVVHVTHAEYVSTYCRSMLDGCQHR